MTALLIDGLTGPTLVALALLYILTPPRRNRP